MRTIEFVYTCIHLFELIVDGKKPKNGKGLKVFRHDWRGRDEDFIDQDGQLYVPFTNWSVLCYKCAEGLTESREDYYKVGEKSGVGSFFREDWDKMKIIELGRTDPRN